MAIGDSKIFTFQKNDDSNININIYKMKAMEAVALRSEIALFLKQKVSSQNINPVSVILEVLYILPQELLLKIFRNCNVEGSKSLGNKETFDEFFTGELDLIYAVALEVLDYNGFFTTRLWTILEKKMPQNITAMIKDQFGDLMNQAMPK